MGRLGSQDDHRHGTSRGDFIPSLAPKKLGGGKEGASNYRIEKYVYHVRGGKNSGNTALRSRERRRKQTPRGKLFCVVIQCISTGYVR